MSIVVERPGLLTTVQDLGRSARRHGVSRGGAMDRHAARVANLLVGNDERAAVLEATLLGPTLRLEQDAVLAITGADMHAMLDDAPVRCWRAFRARAGSTLALHTAALGCRAYVAVHGGIDAPAVLGSRATDVAAGIGRPVAAGDVLAIGGCDGDVALQAAGPSLTRYISPQPLVRFIEGPEHAWFSDVARAALETTEFEVTAQSNRMGYRLHGPTLERDDVREMISSPVVTGMVQVPPSGDPIVLMADAQTIGGYPRIASVITADLRVLAQAPPGASIRFVRVSVHEAQALHRRAEQDIRLLRTGLRLS